MNFGTKSCPQLPTPSPSTIGVEDYDSSEDSDFIPELTSDDSDSDDSDTEQDVASEPGTTTTRYGRVSRRPERLLHPESYIATNFPPEPKSFEEAINSPEAQQWKAAMDIEMQALKQHKTYVLKACPTSRKPIGVKWVYKRKLNPDGSINKYKARLVAKGYNQ